MSVAESQAIPEAPADPVLPGFSRALDPTAMADVLARSLGAPVEQARVRYLRYKPGRRLVVEYDVVAEDGSAHSSVCAIDRKRQPLELLQWYPFDACLPALALPPAELARAFSSVPETEKAERLGYKPLARATVRLGDCVVKLYASASKHAAASSALERVARSDVPGAAFLGSSAELRATAQRLLAGTTPDALDAAPAAGALLRRFHALGGERADRAPQRRLEEAARAAAVVSAVAPAVAQRVAALLARLSRTLPAAREIVTAHGDFEPGQLLADEEDLVVVDVDELCAAAPAQDLAWYAAHTARGRPDDLERARETLEALCDGYGTRPAGLEWHLAAAILARAPFPFRRQDPDWPERVEALVAAAGAA
jgi:hypothetical protein